MCCAWQRQIFFKKICCPKNGENRPKIGLKIGFFGFIGKFSHQFFLNLVYKESSYYLLYSCTNPILGKNLVPEIWAKMLSANQIAGFLNWLYLQNTKIKKAWFFACWYRLMEIKSWLPLWSKYTKIDCISKRNSWKKLVFGFLIKI